MTLVDALLAISHSDRAAAISAVEKVTMTEPNNSLASALHRYLNQAKVTGVYEEPSSFEEFIDNGTNPALYTSTTEHLAELHRGARPSSVLDIGCGDGRVASGVLAEGIETIDLVEPSNELLTLAQGRANWRPAQVRAHNTTVQPFLTQLEPTSRFDLVQSTFALHSIPPTERSAVLGGLARHTDYVVLVEFDVPPFEDRSLEHAIYAVDRYQIGVSEYRDHQSVIDGFLMPVLVSQFDPAQMRHTFEGPAKGWTEDFEGAGFSVTLSWLTNYWWAPAFVLEARQG